MTLFVLASQTLPYGIAVYRSVLNTELCDRLIDYFEIQPKTTSPSLVKGKPRTFAELLLDEDVCSADPLLRTVMRKVRTSLDTYFDTYIADPEFRDHVKAGCYSLQPRMKRYDAGGAFPLHTDDSSLLGMTRRFAYILYLNDTFDGGRTLFPNASGEVARVAPEQGSLLVFPVHPVYMHQGERVERGSKYILNGFAKVLTSQTRVVSDGPVPSRFNIVAAEVTLLYEELMRAAGRVFRE